MGKPKNPNPLPKPKARLHVELDLRALDSMPDALDSLVTSIVKLAPQSPLYSKPGMKDAVDALGKSFDAFKQSGAAAGTLRKQVQVADQAWADDRHENDTCLLLVKTLTEKYAVTEGDFAGMAFTLLVRQPAQALLPVESIDLKVGKKGSGRATATAHETGPTRWNYAAESSPDPNAPNSWSTLVGDGKQRKLTGKSGQSIWVRFARKRGAMQSEWSTPVQITFP